MAESKTKAKSVKKEKPVAVDALPRTNKPEFTKKPAVPVVSEKEKNLAKKLLSGAKDIRELKAVIGGLPRSVAADLADEINKNVSRVVG